MNRQKRDRELMGDMSCRDPSWVRAVAIAMNKPALGITAVVAVTVALFSAGMARVSPFIFVLAALFVSVWIQVATPRFWVRLRRVRADSAPVLPDVLSFRDPLVAGLVLRLTRARHARHRAIADSPFGRHHGLSSGQRAVGDLERRALVAAARGEYVRNFLAQRDESAVDGEVARLRRAESETPYEEAGSGYRHAAEWSTERHEVVARLERRAAALLAQLEHLVVLLESLPAKLTEAELLRIEEGDPALAADIAELEVELAQLGTSDSAADATQA